MLLGDVIFSGVLPTLLCVGLVRVVKVGWYTLVAFGFMWGARDLYLYYSSQGAPLGPILVHLSIYLLSLFYFINPRIRHLYFDPKLRWWRTKHRYETHSPALVHTAGDWQYPILRNVSEGGCFLETPHALGVNEPLEVAIPLPIPLNVAVIRARGEVRWISRDPLRPGMGVQFQRIGPATARALRSFVLRQL